MSISLITGLCLDSCSFSSGSYTFEFSGMKNDIFHRYSVSTSYYFSLSDSEKVDAEENFSLYVWRFLGQELTSVMENDESFEVTFAFGEVGQFVVWGDSPPSDNLLIVEERETGEWFAVL